MSTKASGYAVGGKHAPHTGFGGMDNFLKLLSRELYLLDPEGHQINQIEDTQRFAQETASKVIDASKTWQEHLGPFYDVESVSRLLAKGGKPLTRQAISKRKNLLALTTGSKRVVYPTFQFRDRNVAPGLDKVLKELPESLVSRWTLASWLVSKEPDLDGLKPIDVLYNGGVERVLGVARYWAHSLSA